MFFLKKFEVEFDIISAQIKNYFDRVTEQLLKIIRDSSACECESADH